MVNQLSKMFFSIVLLLMPISTMIFIPIELHAQGDRGYQAVCGYGGCGWKGPKRFGYGQQPSNQAEQDKAAHNKSFPDHYVQVMIIDRNGN